MNREETRGKTLEQIKQEVEGGLVAYLQEEVDRLDPAVPAVLCAHVNIAGAKTASEQSMMLGNDTFSASGPSPSRSSTMSRLATSTNTRC